MEGDVPRTGGFHVVVLGTEAVQVGGGGGATLPWMLVVVAVDVVELTLVRGHAATREPAGSIPALHARPDKRGRRVTVIACHTGRLDMGYAADPFRGGQRANPVSSCPDLRIR